jgi:hypothetical protein
MVSSPWHGYKITSPATKIIKRASDQFSLWLSELRRMGLEFEEGDAVTFWNLLSAIYALTEEEQVKLRATDAYTFSGGSATTGKRKLAALIRAKLVLTTENPAKRTEKFVTVSKDVKAAVIKTLDSLADNYKADTTAYLKYRRLNGAPS